MCIRPKQISHANLECIGCIIIIQLVLPKNFEYCIFFFSLESRYMDSGRKSASLQVILNSVLFMGVSNVIKIPRELRSVG